MKTTHTTPILYIDGIDLHQRELLEWIPYMSIPQRKALLTITRSQPTSRFSNTFQRTSADLSSPLSYEYDGERLHPTVIRDTIFDTLLSSSSVFHGLVNMVARTAPFLCSKDEIDGALQSGISKEVSSALGSYPAVSLNWSSLFSSSPPSNVILGPGYPADADLVVDIRQSVYHALKSLSRRTLVPDMSDKSSLAVKLGYMTSRVKSRKVILRDYHEEVLAIWTRSFDYSHVVCEYVIEEDIPLFLSEMISMPIYSEYLDPMDDLE
jgi:hypothetical protein